jgi:colanic acid biosynthesis glycosyl transferase WcaI
MHILFITDNFPPECNAPASRTYEHARRWVKSGHQVSVITCHPNFPEGRIFPGHRNAWYKTEQTDGIRVVRVKTYVAANSGFLKRTLDYMSLVPPAIVAGLFQRRPDVVVSTSPQFFAAIAGWMLSVLHRRPYVFELRDLWPASIVGVDAMRQGLAIRMLEWLELTMYRRASAVVSVTRSFRDDLVGRGIDPEKIHVVLNGIDGEHFSPGGKPEKLAAALGIDGAMVVGYLGTHGMAHGLENVLAAAERLRDRADIKFLFVGGGADRERIVSLARDRGLSNVRFVPMQQRHAMADYWRLCDLALVHLRDRPVFSTVIPSKIFEAMATRRPVLLSVPAGEARTLVEETGIGVWVNPDDPWRLAAAISDLAGDPARRARMAAACARAAPGFTRAEQAGRMLCVFSDAIARHAQFRRARRASKRLPG